ncbi:MAG: hypothetical protein AB7O24_04590 [Kofleriaceae bacterium]
MTTRFQRVLWVAVLAAGATACADDGGDPVGGESPGDEPLINGVPASEFYDQFAWASSESHAVGFGAFPAATDGRNEFGVQLFLMPGGKAELFYQVGVREQQGSLEITTFDPATKKRKASTWQVDGATLQIGSVMHCEGLTSDGHPALGCELDASIVSPQAVGRLAILENQFGENSPDDPEFDTFQDVP